MTETHSTKILKEGTIRGPDGSMLRQLRRRKHSKILQGSDTNKPYRKGKKRFAASSLKGGADQKMVTEVNWKQRSRASLPRGFVEAEAISGEVGISTQTERKNAERGGKK